jgi:hypothetical protein
MLPRAISIRSSSETPHSYYILWFQKLQKFKGVKLPAGGQPVRFPITTNVTWQASAHENERCGNRRISRKINAGIFWSFPQPYKWDDILNVNGCIYLLGHFVRLHCNYCTVGLRSLRSWWWCFSKFTFISLFYFCNASSIVKLPSFRRK